MSLSTGAVGTTETDNTSEAVVAAVAAETGRDPLELQPLYEVCDPDALDALFDGGEPGETAPAHVEFRYAGCAVSVSADDAVDVTQIVD